MTREEAIWQIENRWDIMDYGESKALGEALDMAIEALQSEVVMCKDCKWRKKNKFCLEHNRYEKNDDGYCHYGERGTYERK